MTDTAVRGDGCTSVGCRNYIC